MSSSAPYARGGENGGGIKTGQTVVCPLSFGNAALPNDFPLNAKWPEQTTPYVFAIVSRIFFATEAAGFCDGYTQKIWVSCWSCIFLVELQQILNVYPLSAAVGHAWCTGDPPRPTASCVVPRDDDIAFGTLGLCPVVVVTIMPVFLLAEDKMVSR